MTEVHCTHPSLRTTCRRVRSNTIREHDRVNQEIRRREGPIDSFNELQVGRGVDHVVLEILPVEVLHVRLFHEQEVLGGQSDNSAWAYDPRELSYRVSRSLMRTEVFDGRKRPPEIEGVCRIDIEVRSVEGLELNDVAADGSGAKR